MMKILKILNDNDIWELNDRLSSENKGFQESFLQPARQYSCELKREN